MKQCKFCKSYISKKANIFCDRKCFDAWRIGKFRGANSCHWKGGRIIDSKDGYILIYKREHPFARKRDGYVLEHRLVCEQVLGRYLKPCEIPHHINGDKSDNRPENLYLFESKSKHTSYHLFLKKNKIKRITKSNLPN